MRRIRIYGTSEQALYRATAAGAGSTRYGAAARPPCRGSASGYASAARGTCCSPTSASARRRRAAPAARTRPQHRATTPEISATINAEHYPHLLRIWNYLPDINHASHGNGRYRQFNSARQHALRASGRARQPVAGVFPGRAHGAGVRGEPAAAERQSLPAAARRAQPRCFRGPRWCAGRGASRCSSPAPVLAGVERARLPSSARRIPG